MRLLPVLLCFMPFVLSAQYKVRMHVSDAPSSSVNIYVAGDFNNWNPADVKYLMKKTTEGFDVDMLMKEGQHEFKFTPGSWDHVEVNADQSGISNRVIKVLADTIFNFVIGAWKKNANPVERKHSMTGNVKIIDTAFKIPQLNRTRRIWIYLPASYGVKEKHYPVLYMHDGQNLFDESTSYSGEWGVDETLDSMFAECIVVGIDNGSEKRMNEYSVHDMEKYGKGEGKLYLEFIVKTLKPYIDKNYRTLKSRQSTFMAGSSMGGLISLYAGLYYPQIFGGLGIFSPAFWVDPAVAKQTEHLLKTKKRAPQKFFFYAGGAENETMVTDMLNVFEIVRKYNKTGIKVLIRQEGIHHESRWREEFAGFYRWVVGAVAR